MAHLKNSQCAYNSKYSLNETIYILIIPKKKSFETFLKIRNGFKVFDMFWQTVPDFRCTI